MKRSSKWKVLLLRGTRKYFEAKDLMRACLRQDTNFLGFHFSLTHTRITPSPIFEVKTIAISKRQPSRQSAQYVLSHSSPDSNTTTNTLSTASATWVTQRSRHRPGDWWRSAASSSSTVVPRTESWQLLLRSLITSVYVAPRSTWAWAHEY